MTRLLRFWFWYRRLTTNPEVREWRLKRQHLAAIAWDWSGKKGGDEW